MQRQAEKLYLYSPEVSSVSFNDIRLSFHTNLFDAADAKPPELFHINFSVTQIL